MKKILLYFAAFAALWSCGSDAPKTAEQNLPAPKDREAVCLRFNRDGQFKILQLTDLHLSIKNETHSRNSERTFARIPRLVQAERPDLIVLTGDNVTDPPAQPMWDRLMDTLAALNTPFVLLYGNHDAEQGLGRDWMSRMVVSNPASLNTLNAAGELADIELPVYGRDGKKVAAALYCMDSHDYSDIPGIEGYAWFAPGQLQWLGECCDARTAENGGKHLPSYAFFHIPLKECREAWQWGGEDIFGCRGENEAPGVLNSGMFSAMLQSGNIVGMFYGHDHDNDYMVAWQGLALCYGRFAGEHTVYTHLRPGARVIVLKEGTRSFETWIREDYDIIDRALFDNGRFTWTD